ncbi:MAG: PilN domain-containing protein [Actinobacteria bacterium]|nr:PilN domain-containing protein [Actinomycetota bacterium]
MVRRINLVPADQRQRTSTDLGFVAVGVLTVMVLVGLAFGFFYYSGILSEKEAELADLQSQNAQLAAQVAALMKFQEIEAQRQAAEDLVRIIYAGRTLVSEVLGDLSLVVPDNVWFGAVNLTAGDPPPAPIAGQADIAAPAVVTHGSLSITGNTYSFEDVARFLVRLDQMPSLGLVTLGSAGDPVGTVDPAKEVRGFAVTATVYNTQSEDTQLPVSRVEVEAP